MTDNAKKHVDSCRFCWMCRHICPIGNATGLERNTARARALGLSLVNRGVYDLSEVADNVYECACCGACTKECATGWDPVLFIKEARLDAALEDQLPDYIGALVDAALETGSAYGKTALTPALDEAIRAHEKKEKLLFFLGADALGPAQASAVTAIRAMEKLNVPFTVLREEPASGWQLEYLISAADETLQQAKACAAALNEFETVVVYDPQDAKLLKHDYPAWDLRLTGEVLTFTAFLARALEAGTLTLPRVEGTLTCQDPFQLSRDLGETAPLRALTSACGEFREMLCSGKDTMWAGNLLMARWMPDVMLQVAKDRLRNAAGVKANVLVTASVSEYENLKRVTDSTVRVLSLEEIIAGI